MKDAESIPRVWKVIAAQSPWNHLVISFPRKSIEAANQSCQ
jgi:hypothetical protein